jgi:hypothetical protein
MGETERTRFVSASLLRTGYLRSASDAPDASFSDAVARYQADNDLVPNGHVDFDLYYRMLANDARRAGGGPVATPAAAVVPAVQPGQPQAAPFPAALSQAAPSRAAPPHLVLATPRGPHPSYRIGEAMVLAVQSSQDAYVYCYYQDSAGTVARIFPNRFQPDPFLRAGAQIEVPPEGRSSFAIRFDKPGGSEAVACLGSDREVGLRLPSALKAQDLEPLPVQGLDDVAARFRAIPGGQVDDARLAVEVLR